MCFRQQITACLTSHCGSDEVTDTAHAGCRMRVMPAEVQFTDGEMSQNVVCFGLCSKDVALVSIKCVEQRGVTEVTGADVVQQGVGFRQETALTGLDGVPTTLDSFSYIWHVTCSSLVQGVNHQEHSWPTNTHHHPPSKGIQSNLMRGSCPLEPWVCVCVCVCCLVTRQLLSVTVAHVRLRWTKRRKRLDGDVPILH